MVYLFLCVQCFVVRFEEMYFIVIFDMEVNMVCFFGFGVLDGYIGSVNICFLFDDVVLNIMVWIGVYVFFDYVYFGYDQMVVWQYVLNFVVFIFIFVCDYDDFIIMFDFEYYVYLFLKNFWCQGDDFYELFGMQFMGYWFKDLGIYWCFVVV